MNQNKREYVNRMRALAAAFIRAADVFANAQAERTYASYEFSQDDFAGSDITDEQFELFVNTLGGLLGNLSVEQKQAIYAVKGAGIIPPPPINL